MRAKSSANLKSEVLRKGQMHLLESRGKTAEGTMKSTRDD
jgi:hypothetical protein